MPPKQQTDNNEEGVVPSWRRSGSFRNRMQNIETTTNSAPTSKFIEHIFHYISQLYFSIFKPSFSNNLTHMCDHFPELEDKDNNVKTSTVPNKASGEPDVVLRRTHSFETDEK